MISEKLPENAPTLLEIRVLQGFSPTHKTNPYPIRVFQSKGKKTF
jgi:hypothetical protein